jgi:hypothetical protein
LTNYPLLRRGGREVPGLGRTLSKRLRWPKGSNEAVAVIGLEKINFRNQSSVAVARKNLTGRSWAG